MAWRRGGNRNRYPGRGPFSHLPPWQRPGWLYGPGSCWWLYGSRVSPMDFPPLPQNVTAEDEKKILSEQRNLFEEQIKVIQDNMQKIEDRLNQLSKEKK